MKAKILRNLPLPFRRRRTKLVSVEFGVFAVILVLGVAHAEKVASGSNNDIGSDVLRPPTSLKSFPPSANVISTNFASLKNNTFRIASGKKFGKYFLSKKLTATTGHGFFSGNVTEPTISSSTTSSSGVSLPIEVSQFHRELTGSSGSSPSTSTKSSTSTTQTSSTTTKPTTSRPTTIRSTTTTAKSTTRISTTTPGYEFITPEVPNLTDVADFTVPGDILKLKPKPITGPSSNQSILFDNFFEVLPVPSGFEGNGVGKLQGQDDFMSNDLLPSDQEPSPSQPSSASLSMHPDPDNLEFSHQEEKDLDVPDQIAMGTDMRYGHVVPPPGGRPRGPKSKMTRRFQQIVGANFPQNFQKFGVQDGLYLHGSPTQVPTISGKHNNNGFRNGRRHPHPSGFPGTPPPQSQAKSFKNVIGGINTRVTFKPTVASATFGYPKGGLHEINPYTGTTVRPHHHNHHNHSPRPSNHNVRANQNPNVQSFSPYNPPNKHQNSQAPHHIQSVRSQGPNSYQGQTHYNGPQTSNSHHTPTTFRPAYLQTTSLPVNHPNSWQPSPPLYRQNYNNQLKQFTNSLNGNLLQAGSMEVPNIVHPGSGNFGLHPPTPPPASHLQGSESILGSFLTGSMHNLLGGGPQKQHHPTQRPVYRPTGPMNQGNGFRQFGSNSAGISGPDAGHSHAPTGPGQHRGHGSPTGPGQHRGQGSPTGPGQHRGQGSPTGPGQHRQQGSQHPPRNQFQGPSHAPQNTLRGPAISLPQEHFQGPPPKELKLGPPPLNEFNIMPIPQNQPKHSPQQQSSHSSVPHHHPQHSPNNQASHLNINQFASSPPAGVEQTRSKDEFGDFKGFHGSNLPLAESHKPHGQRNFGHESNFANFPSPSPPQHDSGHGGAYSFPKPTPTPSRHLEPPGFQLFPPQEGAPQNNPFNVGSPESPWVPKTKGRSHPHRHHHHSKDVDYDEFSKDSHSQFHRTTSSPRVVRPGLAGLSNDNTPALLGLQQLQELDEFTGEIANQGGHHSPAQSHLSFEQGGPPSSPPSHHGIEHGGSGIHSAGFYELPSTPNLRNGRPGSHSPSEQDHESPNDAEMDPTQNSGSNSAEGPDGSPPPQGSGDVTVFNDISGGNSAENGENLNQAPGEIDGSSQSFQSIGPGSGATRGRIRYRRPRPQPDKDEEQIHEPDFTKDEEQMHGPDYKDFGGFSVDPTQTPYPQAQPQPKDQNDPNYQDIEGYSNEGQMQHDHNQNSQHPGYQDFGSFPGQSATPELDDVAGDDQGSNEMDIGGYTPPSYNYQGNNEKFNAAPHFQTISPVSGDFHDVEEQASEEVSRSVEDQVPVISSGYRGQGQTYNKFKQDSYPHHEHHPQKHHRHQHHHQQHHQQAPYETSERPQIPGPEFNGGLNGFDIGPQTVMRPLQRPSTGPGIQSSPGIGQSRPIANGHLVLGVPHSSQSPAPTGAGPLRGSLGGGLGGHRHKKPIQLSSPPEQQPKVPHQHHKAPHHSPHSGLFNFGGILGPLKGLGLMKAYLDSHASHGHGVGHGHDEHHDLGGHGHGLGDKFKFNMPNKHEFNFGKTADSFNFEQDKLKIMKPNFNFGNEGFSFGHNKFNFGQEAQKFGKDPFGKNPFGHDHIGGGLGGLSGGGLGGGGLGGGGLGGGGGAHPIALKHNLKYPVGKVVKAIVSIGHKILDFYAKFSIPKDHYVRVASFAGIYLLMAWLIKDNEHILYPKCENWGWNAPEHHTYHAPAYFVPAMPVDPHLQQEFLDLFRGVEGCLDHEIKKDKKKKKKKKDKKKKDGDRFGKDKDKEKKKKGGDSSEEQDDDDDDGDSMEADYQDEIGFINEMCARDRFFFSMSPYHIEAWAALARIFVEQKTPKDVLHLARSLLHNHRLNPNVWYYALSAAAGQRPDMLGLAIAAPIDAIPDLLIPGHLIEKDMKRYRGLGLPDLPVLPRTKRSASAFLASLKKSLNGTIFRGSVRDRYQRFIASLNATAYSTARTTTRTTTIRTTTTSLPPRPLTTAAAVMLERLDKLFANETVVIEDDPKRAMQLGQKKGDESVEYSDEIYDDFKNGKNVKKHPMGHGYGYIGDGFGKYKGSGFGGSGYGADGAGAEEGVVASFELGGPGVYSGGNRDGLGSGGSGSSGANANAGNALGGFPGSGNKMVSAFPARQGGNSGRQDRVKNKNKQHKKKGKGKKKKKKDKKKKCIIVDGSVGLDNGIENKLWYFREDIMMNQHHWYWHQAYPTNASLGPNTDRRSELFFFMHRNMIARYNAERLSNGFHRTNELDIRPGALIPEPYNAHLKDFNSGSWWTPRAPDTPLLDILHMNDPDHVRDIIINDVFNLYNKFVLGIKLGKLISSTGQLVPIRFGNGFEALSSTVEASNLSVNPFIYDQNGFHNAGHMMVGLSTDPDYKKRLPGGVMTDAGTSMRDPTFYTLHTMIDNLFDKYKKTLPPYRQYGGAWQLQWHGVDVLDVKLHMLGIGDPNQLATFFIKHKFQLEPGVDRSIAKGIEKADICAVHLDHAPFQYQITIDRKKCAKSKSGLGTVRIFMAPRFNEHGDRIPLLEQRRLMFEMDVFQAELKIGRNTITRDSRDSALTRPWTRSLRDYEKNPGNNNGAADYCGCGWPHHLLIPKGNTKGMAFDLFVMVTNFDEDFVANEPVDLEFPEPCTSAYIFCGRPRRRYPDARPMGYPFDRLPYHVPAKACYSYGHSMKDLLCKLTGKLFTRPAGTLEEYVSGVTNMGMTIFEIKHIPKVIGKHVG